MIIATSQRAALQNLLPSDSSGIILIKQHDDFRVGKEIFQS